MVSRTRKSRINRRRRIDRLQVITGVFFVLLLLVVVRLFRLQVVEGSFYRALAQDQRYLYEELIPSRGAIFARFGNGTQELQPLAINEQRSLVYAVPSQISNPSMVAQELSELLEVDRDTIYARVSKEGDLYEPIKHKVPTELVERLEAKNLTGLRYLPEPARVYPLGSLSASLTGFVGFDEDKELGRYGLEQFFEEVLAGEQGFLQAERDPAGRLISFAQRSFTPAHDGADLILTIDPNIQSRACQFLADGVERHAAEAGSLIVMEPRTGRILSLCVAPSYDPNHFNEVEDINIFRNQAVSDTYEPGSIFKVITMAAALDAGAVTPDTTYVDEGEVRFADFTIRNADNKTFGQQDMNEVIQKSINTGAVYAALETGRDTFTNYIRDFGFGTATEIQLPAEAKGDISPLNKKGEIYTATASFGQGITVTPIQMVTAVSAIANKGLLMTPSIVDEIRQADGQVIQAQPKSIRQVIKPATATRLSAMLVSAIEEGYGAAARVDGFYAAGKTGTAQIAGSAGYSTDTIHSFVGFAPISEPKFTILVKLDKPQIGRFAAATAAPIFRDLASFLLQYYQVTPER